MKKWKRFILSIFSLALLFSFQVSTALAADDYQYQITFFAGAQGQFSSTEGLTVEGSDYQISREGDRIVIRGLNYGDRVSFQAQSSGAVSLNEDSKYYIKGVRKSGRDNDTVYPSAFRVTEDCDYVVAYGVKGNLTSYVVHYQDEQGNTLAPSSTFYGNVGDKPVVAYLYIEGYLPQALGLTKTLSENVAENVFTFVYTQVDGGTVTVPGEGTTAQGGTTQGGTAAQEGTGEGAGQGEAAQEGDAGAAGGEGTQEVEIPDEDVPLAPDDVIDLDDEEVPLASAEDTVSSSLPIVGGVVIGVAALIALIAIVVVAKKRTS